MAKDKKGQKEAVQESKAPEQARHSAKERPRLRSRFEKEVAPALLKELELSNKMAVPRLHKIVVNMGVGEATQNAKVLDPAVNELGQITGQKPVVTRAKKSIAAFSIVGIQFGHVSQVEQQVTGADEPVHKQREQDLEQQDYEKEYWFPHDWLLNLHCQKAIP